MNARTLVALISMILMLVPVGWAKSKPSGPVKELGLDDIVARMKFQLQLTDEQAVNIKPIIADYLAKEKQLKLDEQKALSRVLTHDQMYAWNFIQKDKPSKDKDKKHRF